MNQCSCPVTGWPKCPLHAPIYAEAYVLPEEEELPEHNLSETTNGGAE